MKDYMQKIYGVCVCICICFFLYSFFAFRLNIHRENTENGYERLTAYDMSFVEDGKAPAGIRKDYLFKLDNIESSYNSFVFYTIHQNTRVDIDGKIIYSMKPDPVDQFGKSPGCVWNEVFLNSGENGKIIRVSIYPVYQSSAEVDPDFYFGEKSAIYRDVFKRNLPSMFLSVIAVLFGCIFIFYILYNYKNTEVNKELMMLGCFSLQIGVWKFTDSEVFNLLFPGHQAMSYAPFLALMLVPIPFVLFIKELHSSSENKIWYIPCIASIVNIAAALTLQWLNLADMRQTLWMTHLVLLLVVIVTVAMVIYEVIKTGWNQKLRRNIGCMGICFLGLTLDMSLYYITRGKSVMVLGMFGFMTYIIVLGLNSMKEAKQLMSIGMRARKFEQMAYHDQLTGLYNRTAYAEYIGQDDFMPDRCIVIVFDLNELKKCNDTLGHEKGDEYIRESARLIRETFGDIGQCYRMGGDEFCVLVRDGNMEECRRRIKRLKDKAERYTREHADIRMEIACGCEIYDRRIDYDINDTSRRADKVMYHEKFSMKQEREEDKA